MSRTIHIANKKMKKNKDFFIILLYILYISKNIKKF